MNTRLKGELTTQGTCLHGWTQQEQVPALPALLPAGMLLPHLASPHGPSG